MNSVKGSAIFLFAMLMGNVFTTCDNDNDNDDVDTDMQEAPVEPTRSIASSNYDDLAILLGTLAETDASGQVVNRYYGEPLYAENPTHLYIGVDKLQEAKDMFLLWMAPDVKTLEHPDGSITAHLTDMLGRDQGYVCFKPGTEKNHVAEVTTNIAQQHFSQITFLKNEAWPSKRLMASKRFCKFDIVRNVKLKDLDGIAPKEDRMLNFVCIQGSANGVKPVFCAITNKKYNNPLFKAYIKKMRNSRYCPGSGTYPTAANIHSIMKNDWSTFRDVFNEAGNGKLVGGTEYWYDESHFTFIWEYNGVMDYQSGYTYGEDKSQDYYFLFRMYGLDDSKIYDGMTF